MSTMSSSMLLIILLYVTGCLCQPPTRRARCPTPAPCPQCPPSVPVAAATKAPPPVKTADHICECKFNVMNTCGAGDNCKWELAFKAVKGNGRDVWLDFTDLNLINENSAIAKEISDSREPFKNDILNEWNRRYIKEVKVEVYQNGVKKAWLLFNGEGSSRFDWFTQENLISSSYGNALKLGTFAFFSAQGDPVADSRFFINENNGPCTADCGYLNVVNINANICPWAKIAPKPYFLFSPKPDDCCVWHDATSCGEVKADIVCLMDVSGSIDNTEFKSLIAFVKRIVDGFKIGPDKTQVGVVTFGNDIKFDFKLNQHKTKNEVNTALDQIINRGGQTRTDLALNFLKSTAFLPTNGARAVARKVVFVLTDGRSTNGPLTQAAINNIASENYLVFTVGIGSNLNEAELNSISSDPDSTFSLRADFNNLGQIVDQLIDSACKVSAPIRDPRKVGQPAVNEKIADVFAISVKTCDVGW